jgi:hypothetical protein
MATDEADPRILFGKISEISTQVTGASDVEYKAIAKRTNIEIKPAAA